MKYGIWGPTFCRLMTAKIKNVRKPDEVEYTLGYFNENHVTLTTADNTFTSNGPSEELRDGFSLGQVIGFFIAKEAMAAGTYTPATPHMEDVLKLFKDLAIHIDSIVHVHPTPDIKGLPIQDIPIDIIEVKKIPRIW